MILTAHQPVYLPWLGLFHKVALADTFCFFDDVQYQPKSYNNRNKIKMSNGPHWLSVPVLRAGYLERSYLDIKINNSIDWRKKHWRSIESSYNKAPFFEEYADKLRPVYETPWRYLVDLNFEMILTFLRLLGLKPKVVKMSDYEFKGTKSELVLDMCKTLEADIYIFGEEGRNYVNVLAFHEASVAPYFQSYIHPEYPQIGGEFVPYLSVIDLLFNCGPSSLDIILSENVSPEQFRNLGSGLECEFPTS